MAQATKPTDDVTFKRAELITILPRYTLVRDCVDQLVKNKGALYLPQPSPEDTSEENKARYTAYIERAVFYNVTGRTLNGMVGQIYARPPQVKVPAILDVMTKDATGSGLTLEQLSKDTMDHVVSVGRAGLYVDYPTTNGATTRQQLLDGEVRPTITSYAPENIINWRTTTKGSRTLLSLVVLEENVDVQGEFAVQTEKQYRELRLIDGVYTVRLWREEALSNSTGEALPGVVPTPATTGGTALRAQPTVIPVDSKGFPFSEIPFVFIGAMNNDTTIDAPPLYDLAELNVAHYRNSADYEESCFITGQPTPWFSGLTQEWVEDVLDSKVLLGARAAVLLPESSQAGLLQVAENSMPIEAMKHKEVQMVALGARLVENRAVRRTASEVTQANASETSILASCANNVSAGYKFALQKAAAFVGANADECEFTLNTDFAVLPMSAEDRMQLIADMQGGALSFTEVRGQLRRIGIATQDDKDALAEINARDEKQAALAAKGKPAPTAGPKPPDNRSK